ncbi:hypothetical protein [Thermococcus sp.]
MRNRKYGLFVLISVILILGTYYLWWLHYKTISSEGPTVTVEGKGWLIPVNASKLSCILGREEPLGFYVFSNYSDIFVEISYRPVGFRNVGCNQLSVSGNSTLYIRPKNDSIAITHVLFFVKNMSNVSVDSVFPKRLGVMYFKINNGKFDVVGAYVPGLGFDQAFQVRALGPTWGETISLNPYIPLNFDKKGNPDVMESRAFVVLKVDYLVRTGFFTSEKREMTIRMPLTVRFYNLQNCTHDCEP